MTRLPPDFKEFLNTLNSNGAEYLLIGGYAVGLYSRPRVTEYIDIWVGTDAQNAAKVFKALEEFGVGPDRETLEKLKRDDQIIRIGHPPFRIEVLTTISGVRFEECYTRRQSHEVDGVSVHVIGLKDLKINKKASGRPKDIADLDVLG